MKPVFAKKAARPDPELLTLKAEGLEGYAEGVMDILPDYLEETQAGALPSER